MVIGDATLFRSAPSRSRRKTPAAWLIAPLWCASPGSVGARPRPNQSLHAYHTPRHTRTHTQKARYV